MKPVGMVVLMVAVAFVLGGSLWIYNNSATKSQVQSVAADRVVVQFSGGHRTEAQDNGHPVALIAPALGVTPAVFREAFFQFEPDAEESDAEAWKKHKSEMMSILGEHGVSDQQLDTVMNYYRGPRAQGGIWPTNVAVAWAIVDDGKITGFEIVNGGSGYTSSPTVAIAGFDSSSFEAVLSFGKQLDENGSISEIRTLGPDSD